MSGTVGAAPVVGSLVPGQAGPTWVIGSGLLGRGVIRHLHASGQIPLRVQVPWTDAAAAGGALADGIKRLAVAAAGGPWRIIWCAGAGVTGSTAAELTQEVDTFRGFLRDLRDIPAPAGSCLFVSSSAGALYAGLAGESSAFDQGAVRPPFTEAMPPRSISAYGDAKLAAEQAATTFAADSGVAVLIGRIANLYGPGQNLAKPQGLISQICRTQLSGQPLSVYVSLDTLRDYLYVDDCAALILAGLDRLATEPGGTVVTKILASQQGVTIGALLAECRRLFKRAPRVVLGSSPNARFQVRDLRLRSVVWPELDQRTLTPLPVGIAATSADVLRSVQLGRVPPR